MYVLLGSVTTAMRLKRLLEKKCGCPAEVVHTPSQLNSGGCSYSVRVDNRYLDTVRNTAEEYTVGIRKIYLDEYTGGERIYHDVS